MSSQLRVGVLFNSPVPQRIAFGGEKDDQRVDGEEDDG
jgi:hypothetical protein